MRAFCSSAQRSATRRGRSVDAYCWFLSPLNCSVSAALKPFLSFNRITYSKNVGFTRPTVCVHSAILSKRCDLPAFNEMTSAFRRADLVTDSLCCLSKDLMVALRTYEGPSGAAILAPYRLQHPHFEPDQPGKKAIYLFCSRPIFDAAFADKGARSL